MKKSVVIIVMISMIVAAWGQEGQFYKLWKTLTHPDKQLWILGAMAGIDAISQGMGKGDIALALLKFPDAAILAIDEAVARHPEVTGEQALRIAIAVFNN